MKRKINFQNTLYMILLFCVCFYFLNYCSSMPSDLPDEDSNSQRLTDKGNLRFYSWHRYSDKVAFSLDKDIWIFHADSKQWVKMNEFADSNINLSLLEWSPEGNAIIYRYEATNLNKPGFKIFNFNTHEYIDLFFYGGYPRWSPNGNTIAFINDDSNNNNKRLSFYRISQKDTVNILRHHELVSWSPDGNIIVFLQKSNIYLYNIELELSYKVGEYLSPGGIKYPSFSPSGDYILFNALSEDEEGKDHLVIFSMLDSSITKVPYSDFTWFPMWTNQESKIAFIYDQDLWVKDIQQLLN